MNARTRERVVVICPGRGTYNATELGYLKRHHGKKTQFLRMLEDERTRAGQPSLIELDQAPSYTFGSHARGDNASLLIFGCALGDFQDIDQERFEIVAVTGNSMGWYLALACSGALDHPDAAHLVNTMGTLMHDKGAGTQIVYPLVDETWRVDPTRIQRIRDIHAETKEMAGAEVYISIRLGGLILFAVNETGADALMEALPPEDRFPMMLSHHAAFHSPLLNHIVPLAQAALPAAPFRRPQVPLIDGKGNIWSPFATDPAALYGYTLGDQINTTYDFSKAIEVSVKEFAPDRMILLGPGNTLGGAIAQELIRHRWNGWTSKADFQAAQSEYPYLISMGMSEQRAIVSN